MTTKDKLMLGGIAVAGFLAWRATDKVGEGIKIGADFVTDIGTGTADQISEIGKGLSTGTTIGGPLGGDQNPFKDIGEMIGKGIYGVFH